MVDARTSLLVVSVLMGCASATPVGARPPAPADATTTTAERTGFRETGRYDEVLAICEALAAKAPTRLRCTRYGTSPEGRPLLAMVAGPAGESFEPAAVRAAGRPVVFVQAGIHAGEIDGKDAGLIVVKELLAEAAKVGARPVLDEVTLVFVPVVNVDGHERMSPNNRPNQRGPAVMGFRTTAQNLNLNRDHAKADAPEMRALLQWVAAWDPILALDLHVTDGAKFQHDIAVMVEPALGGPSALRQAGAALSERFQARLAASGHLPLEFYPEFETHDDPRSGFARGIPGPRFSHGYHALRNRLGVLVETHAWRPYGERVKATADALRIALAAARTDAAGWRRAASEADAEARAVAGREVVLTWKNSAARTTVAFRGYAYERRPSAVSGAMMVRYDESKPETWTLPLAPEVVPDQVVTAPRAGYVVPAGFAGVVGERLAAHGIAFTTLAAAKTLAVEVLRADDAKFSAGPYEGRQTMTTHAAWTRGEEAVTAGALFVPVAQPLGRLVVALMEPTGPDSFAAWGFFNAQLEQKEYMEGYVAEEVAEAMLRDAGVRAAFEARLEQDAAFAASAEQRLDFFYRRHASWDGRAFRVPVFRVDAVP